MSVRQRQEVQALSRPPFLGGAATLREDGEAVLVLDQTQLPARTAFARLATLGDAAQAIRTMQVRGAPLIGAVAAYGVALALRDHADDATLRHAIELLAATRPTAINLRWALTRQRARLENTVVAGRRMAAWDEARAIAALDTAANAAIGANGLAALPRPAQRPLQVLTHCNAGWLATVAHGTALAPVYRAHAEGIAVHVWVSETRPRNQGLLTAWERAEAGVPHTLIADNAAGLLLMQGRIDCVIVGADRIAANGDVANKVGTYLKALAARAHGVRFFVAAPMSTIDFACPQGADIPIEERDGGELGAGTVPVANPAFDITPASLVGAIISERGVLPPQEIGQWKPTSNR